jgi:hypothetical protein
MSFPIIFYKTVPTLTTKKNFPVIFSQAVLALTAIVFPADYTAENYGAW